MDEENDHRSIVKAWLERAARGLPPERRGELLEKGLERVWARAHLTLGDITLTAIVARVLFSASEQFPALSSIGVDSTGLHFDRAQMRANDSPSDQLASGLEFALVEILCVLGRLTAEILTPALHAELARVTLAAPAPTGSEKK